MTTCTASPADSMHFRECVHRRCHKCLMGSYFSIERLTASCFLLFSSHGTHTQVDCQPNQCFHRSTGCPYCSCWKACQCNCLQTQCPDVAAEWDHVRNQRTSSDYVPGSKTLVWWKAPDRPSGQRTIIIRTTHHAACLARGFNVAC